VLEVEAEVGNYRLVTLNVEFHHRMNLPKMRDYLMLLHEIASSVKSCSLVSPGETLNQPAWGGVLDTSQMSQEPSLSVERITANLLLATTFTE
jgi:hypothetical protein